MSNSVGVVWLANLMFTTNTTYLQFCHSYRYSHKYEYKRFGSINNNYQSIQAITVSIGSLNRIVDHDPKSTFLQFLGSHQNLVVVGASAIETVDDHFDDRIGHVRKHLGTQLDHERSASHERSQTKSHDVSCRHVGQELGLGIGRKKSWS